jgi:aminopeptidase
MDLRRSLLLAPLVLLAAASAPSLAAAAAAASKEAAPKPAPADPARIADRIVVEHLQVKDGQIVLVKGHVRAIEFLESLSVAIARHGGSPLQTVTTEQLALRLYQEVPEKYDKMRQAAAIELAELVDAIVRVDSRETPDLLNGIPAARVLAASKTESDVTNILRDRSVPLLVVGNGLWPTAAAARTHGVSVAELTRIFWAAMAVTPDELRETGAAVKAAIGTGKQVRVTHPNGTDLTFSVEERPVLVSDGTTSPEHLSDDVVETHLPAGEVLVVPVRESANGRLVVGRMPFEGGWLEQFSLELKQGRVTKHAGKPSKAYARFKQLYDAAPVIGRDEFALLDIGVNRGARAANGASLLSSIPAGTVTVGIGNNTRGGGETDIPFSFVAPLAGATVTVDGRPVVKKGELVVAPARATPQKQQPASPPPKPKAAAR